MEKFSPSLPLPGREASGEERAAKEAVAGRQRTVAEDREAPEGREEAVAAGRLGGSSSSEAELGLETLVVGDHVVERQGGQGVVSSGSDSGQSYRDVIVQHLTGGQGGKVQEQVQSQQREEKVQREERQERQETKERQVADIKGFESI